MLITVFTPTYNRANTIRRTFNSLICQTAKNFEWLVVDDGSTDDTASLFEEFEARADFPVRYVKKENGGKHTAHNLALELAQGELFFTVDSDDWLPEDSIEKLNTLIPLLEQNNSLLGIIGLKAYEDGSIIGNSFPENLPPHGFRELELTGNGGERSIIFRTEVIKSYPFPVFQYERFMPECVVYDQIDRPKSFVISNLVFTICEYQHDGLSSNPKRLMATYPCGYVCYFSRRIDMATTLKERIGYVLHYHAMFKIACNRSLKYRGEHKFLTSLFSPFKPLLSYQYTKHLKP